MSPKKLHFLSLPLLVLLGAPLSTGCAPSEDPGLTPEPRVLYNFDSCEDLLAYAKKNAKDSLDEYASLYSGQGWGEDFGSPLGDSESSQDENGGGAGVDYSETNIQEAGVDEPDLVKTDGDRILALAGGKLHHVDSTGTPLLTASLEIDGDTQGAEMFLYEDRVLLFQRIDGYHGHVPEGENDGEDLAKPLEVPDAVKKWSEGSWVPITRITEVDISDPNELVVAAKLYVSGDYLSARRVEGVSRVVLRSMPLGLQLKSPWDFSDELGGQEPETEEEWQALWEKFAEQAKEHNVEVIDSSTLDNWVPHYVFEGAGGESSEGLLLDCVDTMRPGVYSGLMMTSVLTLDLEKGLSPKGGVGLFADSAIVYASTDNLYISTSPWVGEGWDEVDWGDEVDGDVPQAATTASQGGGEPMGGDAPSSDPVVEPQPVSFRAEEKTGLTSYLHKFALPAGEKAIYTASGEVRGRLLSQWAMHEHRGDLRVATTDQESWDTTTSESFVTVLREDEGELAMVGQVGDLGKGEEIKSVRYIGDVGYVVTFRQTDPLYTIDLSDHAAPKVAGELKINGYSAYLHPLGEDHLIGVGFDGTDEGNLLGVQVSLFDVSDINAPLRTDSAALGDFGWTEVAFDHKAFLNWEKESLTVFPVESHSWDEDANSESWFLGAVGYTIDPQTGIELRGTVTHTTDPNDPWAGGDPSLRRSLVIGDLLYTVSDQGLKASTVAELGDQAWIEW